MVRVVTAVLLALCLVPRPAMAEADRTPAGKPPPEPPAAKGAGPAGAEGSAGKAPAKPSPAAERVARALTTRDSWNETVSAYAESLSSQISAAVQSQGGEAPKDVEKKVRAKIDDAVGYDELVRLQAQALAGRFSEDELREIGTFYESPAGKKLVTALPEVSRQVIETIQGRISAAIPRIVEDVAPSLARAKPGEAEGSAGSRAAPGKPPEPAPDEKPGREPPAKSPPRP